MIIGVVYDPKKRIPVIEGGRMMTIPTTGRFDASDGCLGG